ncbi:hypothetical protein RHSIM_Rhsim04G0028100 [Rhododendron simsii]|uniref:Uncharacterized protein n=1 Tax=Rhododendron simsii TaxID=118357 RepID=A0A834LSX3_RHOSS|nr:hypothetical protein RHSIM_Rhsim04G0028100 [Rhododendron simsii]
MMNRWLYEAATKGNVSCLSGIDRTNITQEEAMRIQDGIFLKRTQHGGNNILHIAARAGRDNFVAEALRRFPFLSNQVNSQDDDTATAVESGRNSRSSRRQRDVEEGLVDHQLEQGTIQDKVATVENETNSSNISRRQRDVKEGLLDDQLEQATAVENETNLKDIATAPENETKSSSSRRQRDAEEVLVDRQLIHGTTAPHMRP